MAFSTGITCMPMPAPPGGTMGVIFSSGSIVIRSKNAATSGCSSIWLLRMFRNSALPGTNSGSTQRFSCLGFLPSRFSQLYSMMPVHAISVRSFSSGSRSILVSFISCSVVLGLRTPILSATSTISSVITPARPQYSGSSAVALRLESSSLVPDAVRDHTAELEDVFARSVRAGYFEIQFTLVEREIRGLAAVDIAHVPALPFRGVPRACRRAAKISRGDHHLSYPSSILQENVGFFH